MYNITLHTYQVIQWNLTPLIQGHLASSGHLTESQIYIDKYFGPNGVHIREVPL